MSLAAERVPVAKIVDHRVSFPAWSLPVREGGQSVSYLRASATSLGSNVQFDIVPPNPGASVIGRDMLWYNKVTFAVNAATAAPANVINAGVTDAPRAFPITSCVDVMTCQINNETITVSNWAEIGHVLRRFNPKSAMYKLSNFCPWFPDQSAEYPPLAGSNRDVLAAGATGDYDFMRGAYARYTVVPGAAPTTQATITLETVEPVNLSPFMYGSQSPGIPFVQTLRLQFNINNWNRALSHAVVAGTSANLLDSDIKGNLVESTLFYQSISVPMLEEQLPRSISLPHYRLLCNPTNAVALASNVPTLGVRPAGTTLTSQVINYSCIPSRLYVFCAPAQNQKTVQTPDFTAQFCGGLSLQWGSRTALMTSVPRETLYAQAADAGLCVPWEQWDGAYRFSSAAGGVVGSSGSILCIRPGVDFDLEPGQVVGQSGSFQFQISAAWNNQSATNYSMSMYVVAVLPGVLTLNAGYETHAEIGCISQADVLASSEKVHESAVLDTFGSGFFDNIKQMLHHVRSDPLGSLKKAVGTAHSLTSLAKEKLGAGVRCGGSAFSGGSDFYGGAILSKKSLAERLR